MPARVWGFKSPLRHHQNPYLVGLTARSWAIVEGNRKGRRLRGVGREPSDLSTGIHQVLLGRGVVEQVCPFSVDLLDEIPPQWMIH